LDLLVLSEIYGINLPEASIKKMEEMTKRQKNPNQL
jgi:hypothetical protein